MSAPDLSRPDVTAPDVSAPDITAPSPTQAPTTAPVPTTAAPATPPPSTVAPTTAAPASAATTTTPTTTSPGAVVVAPSVNVDAAAVDADDDEWLWIVAVVAALALAVGGTHLWSRRKRAGRDAAVWGDRLGRVSTDVRAVCAAVEASNDAVQAAQADEWWQLFEGHCRTALPGLDSLLADAPSKRAHDVVLETRTQIQALHDAIEYDRWLRPSATAPPQQLAASEATVRQRVFTASQASEALIGLTPQSGAHGS